jgi:hypothetical protein
MKKLLHLITHHWQAKLVSLALAFVLWAVVRKNTETGWRSKFRFERPAGPELKFDISTDR